jgi:hypothetical protein
MGYSYGPSVVKNGMVLCLDAANRKSFVSGSTTWFDLTGNNYTGSLTNGPTFSTDGVGSIVFDGTNDFVNLGNILDNIPTITICTWIYVNSVPVGVNSFFGIVKKADDVNVGAGWAFYYSERGGNGSTTFSLCTMIQSAGSAAYNQPWTSTVFEKNKWLFCCSRVPSFTDTIEMFVNGVKQPNGLYLRSGTVTSTSTSIYTDIARNDAGGLGKYGNHKTGNVMIYNRALSDSEIVQNYNATKGRFGL